MAVNLDTSFDEKPLEGRLPIAKDEKASVLHLPEFLNGILRRSLRGDRNQCPTCQEYFNSSTAFDQHRTGPFDDTRRCLTVAEMQVKNFGKTNDDFWLCPVSLKDRERLNSLRSN
jgi:hypothetical protein